MRKVRIALAVALVCLAARCCADDLLSYVQKPDDSYKWEKVSQSKTPFGQSYMLKMTSQTWQGIVWTHDIQVIRPNQCDFPNTSFLMIASGKSGGAEETVAGMVAVTSGCPVAILYGIPNQPLFDGLKEDNLIAHTFVKAMETGDLTWPLLFPMTKSAIRAMDAVQAFTKDEFHQEISGFVVSGASKRGWTTWLTAAADPVRVKAIIPMVYDNLNITVQMRHQIQCWGKVQRDD